jgi:hypothetical protein
MFIQALIILTLILILYLLTFESKNKENFTFADYWRIPWCVCKRDINIV